MNSKPRARTPLRAISALALLACGLAASVHAQPLVFIDTPGPETGPVLGYLKVSGWALDLDTHISQVTILLDGVPVGSIKLTDARPDVCAVYPNAPDCPMVGWSFLLDTTLYASGSHLIEARATSLSGENATVSSSFTIANWTSGTTDPLRVDIDTPVPQNTSYMGTAHFGGWAVDDVAPITSVSIAIDNVFYGNAGYGAPRPDVCTVFTMGQGCPNVGWNILVDTTTLPDGSHTLDVTATSAGRQSLTATTTFVVTNFSSASNLVVDIDNPSSSSQPFSGAAAFGGWAIDLKSGVSITQVQVFVDGLSQAYASYGASRPDVCMAFSVTLPANCPVGWNFFCDTTLLANGTHTLDVTAYANDGSKDTLSTTFIINNPSNSNNPTKVFIDRPNSQSSTVSGTTIAAGWAVNTTPGVRISYVEIAMDGVVMQKPNYGLDRPDVCKVYTSSSDCPNVGWSFYGNTTQLANGSHTLTATAFATDGTRAVTSAQFTVANWTTSGNPIMVNIETPNSSSENLSGSSVLVGGWAIDTAGGATITNLAISIDSAPLGNATYGGSRPDVCAVYMNVAGCPNVGWNFRLDTTTIPDGSHTLAVTVTTSGGQSYTTTTSITILNNTSSNPTLVDIDNPNAGSGDLAGTVPIGGWTASATSGVTIQAVNLYVDGAFVNTASYGGSRPDVCMARGLMLGAGCPVGWNDLLDTTLFENGAHTLAVVATTSTGLHATQSASFTVDNLPGDPPFRHIVVIVQENRTPDNLFQGLCAPPFGSSASCSTTPSGSQYDIQTDNWLDKTSNSGTIHPGPSQLANKYDLDHRHGAFTTMCDASSLTGACKMDGGADVLCLGTCPSQPAFRYVNNSTGIVNPYLQLATQYGWANYMFQTNQGPSFPAHQYLFGGTSAPSAEDDAAGTFVSSNISNKGAAGCIATAGATVQLINALGIEDPSNKIYPCFEHNTLPDVLPTTVTWRYYAPGPENTLLSIWLAPNAIQHICESSGPGGQCLGQIWSNNVDLNPPDVLSDVSKCTLRNLSWVIPSGVNSDHASINDGGGPSWVASIVNAIGNSSSCDGGAGYWNDTAILIVWDDWGGWYDHEPPTILPPPQGGYQYGFRVPFVVVSAYTPQGYIDNKRHDFGSIIRFIEYNFGVPQGALNFADARAQDRLGGFFNFNQKARKFQKVGSLKDASFFLNDPRPPTDPDDQ